MRDTGWVLTLVSVGPRSSTVVVHHNCLDELVGAANRRKLDHLAFKAGWVQDQMPGFAQV